MPSFEGLAQMWREYLACRQRGQDAHKDALDAVKEAIARHIADEIAMEDGYAVKIDGWVDLDALAIASVQAYEAVRRKEWEKREPFEFFEGVYIYDLDDDGLRRWKNSMTASPSP